MTKAELVQLMTDCTTRVKGKSFSNPFRADVWQEGPNTYEVLYYLTRRYQTFTPVRESQTTPVVLKNGRYDNIPLDVVTSTKKTVNVDRFYNTERYRPYYHSFEMTPLFIMTSEG